MSLPFSSPFGSNSPFAGGRVTPALVMQLAVDLRSAKWYYTAMACLLAYDYCLMFSDEVQYAWRGRKGPVFYLFLLIRYFPIAFTAVMLVSYFSPLWTYEVSLFSYMAKLYNVLKICNRFVVAIWVQTVLIFLPAEIMLTLRVWVLSKKSLLVIVPLSLLMLAQFSLSLYIVSSRENGALKLPPLPVESFHICMLHPSERIAYYDTIFLGLGLAFDSVVFALTLFYTLYASRFGKTTLLQNLQRDGIIYFFALFSGNLVWIMLLLHARPGLKFMNAQPSHLFTSILITRLTISLRKSAGSEPIVWDSSSLGGLHNLSTVDHELAFGDHELSAVNDSTMRYSRRASLLEEPTH